MSVIGYIKTLWQDRAVQYPNRYDKSGETSTSVTLVANPGTVTQAGTPVNATNMNKIENAIESILGKDNTSILQKMSTTLETDTRTVAITRNAMGKVSLVEEKNGSTVIKSTTINYDSKYKVTSVVEVAGGVTVTLTLNRDTAGRVTSVSKTVV
jgi:hypothetical protein